MNCKNRWLFKLLVLLIATQVLGFSTAWSASEKLSLRLQEAIALALRNNLDVRNAYLDRVSDKFSYLVAQHDWKPQYSLSMSLDGDSDYGTTSRSDTVTSGVDFETSLAVPSGGDVALTLSQDSTYANGTADAYTGSATLSFSQPLLKGFGREIAMADLTTAEYSELSSQLSLKSSIISTVTTVIEQYRTCIQAIKQLEIAELSLQRSLQQVEINRELVKAERLPRVDLVQSETDVANQRLSLRSAQNTAETENLTLVKLLRLSPDITVEPTEPLVVSPVELELQDLIKAAKAQQPSYLQSQITLKKAKLTRRVARDDQRWELDLEASYALASDGGGPADSYRGFRHTDEADYAVGLTLTVPIDDISSKQTLVDANIDWIQANNDMISTNESLESNLRDAVQSIQSAWDNVDLAKQSLELSRQQLELEQEKQKAGRSTNFQVVSYQNDLANAEEDYISARISYLNELTELDELLGTTLERWDISLLAEDKLTPEGMDVFDARHDNTTNIYDLRKEQL